MTLRYSLEDSGNESGRVSAFGDSEDFAFELTENDPLTFENFMFYKKENGEWIQMTEEELLQLIQGE